MSLKEILKKLNDILKNDRRDSTVILAAAAVEADFIDPDGAGYGVIFIADNAELDAFHTVEAHHLITGDGAFLLSSLFDPPPGDEHFVEGDANFLPGCVNDHHCCPLVDSVGIIRVRCQNVKLPVEFRRSLYEEFDAVVECQVSFFVVVGEGKKILVAHWSILLGSSGCDVRI